MSRTRRRAPVDVTLPPWGVAVFESHHAADFAAPARRDPFVKVLYILAGAGACEAPGQAQIFTAGDVLLVGAGCEHRLIDRAGKPVSLLAACVAHRHVPAMPALQPAAPRRFGGDPFFAQQVRVTLRRMLAEQTRRAPGFDNMLGALASQLLVQVARQKPSGAASRRPDAAALVRRLLAQPPADWAQVGGIDEIASQIGVSRRTFTTLVRQTADMSWSQHVRRRRIEHAMALLRQTDRSPTAIAFECGFEELSTFYRSFRAVTGCTPARFRGRRQ